MKVCDEDKTTREHCNINGDKSTDKILSEYHNIIIKFAKDNYKVRFCRQKSRGNLIVFTTLIHPKQTYKKLGIDG